MTPAVVAKKKKAKKIALVTYYVNELLVKKVKHPKKGAVVALPVADNEAAELRAVVRLVPKKKGPEGQGARGRGVVRRLLGLTSAMATSRNARGTRGATAGRTQPYGVLRGPGGPQRFREG